MKRLSLVGSWLLSPSHSRKRFLEHVFLLNERHLELETRCGHRVADGLPELRDDHLFRFVDDVQRPAEHEKDGQNDGGTGDEA